MQCKSDVKSRGRIGWRPGALGRMCLERTKAIRRERRPDGTSLPFAPRLVVIVAQLAEHRVVIPGIRDRIPSITLSKVQYWVKPMLGRRRTGRPIGFAPGVFRERRRKRYRSLDARWYERSF